MSTSRHHLYRTKKNPRYRYRPEPQTFVPTINPSGHSPPFEDSPADWPMYPSYVLKTDSVGNDQTWVLVATYTGWALTLRGVSQSPRQTWDILVRYDYLPRLTPSPISSYRKTLLVEHHRRI
jgi:hypothetical protein